MTQCSRVVELDTSGIKSPQQLQELLAKNELPLAGYVNWYALRWPAISMMGGMAMGNVSGDVEFFFSKPFTWSNAVLDYVMAGGGKKYGIRVRFRGVGGPLDIDCRPPEGETEIYHRFSSPGVVKGGRSYMFYLRGGQLGRGGYDPSYILANGRRIWDAKRHKRIDGSIYAPFWHEADGDIVIDMVVDTAYTPKTKGLAFRLGHCQFLGLPGIKASLAGASEKIEESPYDTLKTFPMGLFPSGYDFWTRQGPRFSEIAAHWKPNFKPRYPTDDVYRAPVVFGHKAEGAYHDFMLVYGGCDTMGQRPTKELAAQFPIVRAALARDAADAKFALKLGRKVQAHFMAGEHNVLAPHKGYDLCAPAKLAARAREVAALKRASGSPSRCRYVYEPWPPALTGCAHEYERGTDILILKNEEDPQYNIMMSMARGAGRTFGKPFGFYWEQTHYPYPSLDFKRQALLLYYFSGGSWLAAECEETQSFNHGYISDWVFPFVQAMRFAMVHPQRGEFISRVGVLHGGDDRWWVPYNPIGQLDTFQRHIEYDHAKKVVRSEPAFTKPLWYVPKDRSKWGFETAGHVPYFIDHVDELKGYDLLDVFFPQYGDAFAARTTRLLTGTPYGPVDFVYAGAASAEHLRSFGALAVLGRLEIDAALEKKLTAAVKAGTGLLLGAQHFVNAKGKPVSAFGLTLSAKPTKAKGKVDMGGMAAATSRHAETMEDEVFSFKGADWHVVARIGAKPIIIRRQIGKGEVYVYLGQWMHRGGAAIRPVLHHLGRLAAPLEFAPFDDQVEYVCYQKKHGAVITMFNHGGIVIGSDRILEMKATPPDELASKPKGPYGAAVKFNLERLGLNPNREHAIYQVHGIEGDAFDRVISGHGTFRLQELPSSQREGVLEALAAFNHRGQFVIAPRGQELSVFFGKA